MGGARGCWRSFSGGKIQKGAWAGGRGIRNQISHPPGNSPPVFEIAKGGRRENQWKNFAVCIGKVTGRFLPFDDQARHTGRGPVEFPSKATARRGHEVLMRAEFAEAVGVDDQPGGEPGFVLQVDEGKDGAVGLPVAGQLEGTVFRFESDAFCGGVSFEGLGPAGVVSRCDDAPVVGDLLKQFKPLGFFSRSQQVVEVGGIWNGVVVDGSSFHFDIVFNSAEPVGRGMSEGKFQG